MTSSFRGDYGLYIQPYDLKDALKWHILNNIIAKLPDIDHFIIVHSGMQDIILCAIIHTAHCCKSPDGNSTRRLSCQMTGYYLVWQCLR